MQIFCEGKRKAPSAYQLTRDPIWNPGGFSVFSVVSAQNTPMHQPHAYFMLWANRASWIFQCPITRHSCICQVLWVRRFSGSNFLSQSFALQCPPPLFSRLSPELSVPCFLSDSCHFFLSLSLSLRASKAAWSRIWRRNEVTSRQRLLGSRFHSPHVLTLPVALRLCPAFLQLSFTVLIGLSRWNQPLFVFVLSFSSRFLRLSCSASLHPSLALALALSFMDNLPKEASFHVLDPQAFNTIFNTKPPKVEKLQKETEKEGGWTKKGEPKPW